VNFTDPVGVPDVVVTGSPSGVSLGFVEIEVSVVSRPAALDGTVEVVVGGAVTLRPPPEGWVDVVVGGTVVVVVPAVVPLMA